MQMRFDVEQGSPDEIRVKGHRIIRLSGDGDHSLHSVVVDREANIEIASWLIDS